MAITQDHVATDTTLDQTSDTLINGMTRTPASGNYLVVFTMDYLFPATASNEDFHISIYVGGTQEAHTERQMRADASLDANRAGIGIAAEVSVNGSQAIEIRYRVSTDTFTGKKRTMNLFPKASGDFSQATATADTSTTSGTDVQLDSMTLTPGAGTYLLVFSTSAFTTSASGNPLFAFNVYVNGTIVAHTERMFTEEGSIADTPYVVIIAATVSPGAGEVVEIKWRRDASTETLRTHERTLTLMKVASGDIVEATATADDVVTGTSEVLLNSMTLTDPGANEWLVIFSSSYRYTTSIAAPNIDTFFSLYLAAIQEANTERDFMMDVSVDLADMPCFTAALVTPAGGTDDIDVRWRSSSATEERAAHERTLVAVREAAAVDLPEGQLVTNVNLMSVP